MEIIIKIENVNIVVNGEERKLDLAKEIIKEIEKIKPGKVTM